jgi:hypothetical protein
MSAERILLITSAFAIDDEGAVGSYDEMRVSPPRRQIHFDAAITPTTCPSPDRSNGRLRPRWSSGL